MSLSLLVSDVYTTCHQLVSVVLKWFKHVDIGSISCIGFEVLNQFLSANVNCWEDIVKVAITEGIPVACSLLENEETKEAILTICINHKQLLIDMMKMLAQSCVCIARKVVQAFYEDDNEDDNEADSESKESGGSQTLKTAARAGVKLVLVGGTRYIVNTGAKSIAKQATKSIAKQAAKTVAKQATKQATKSVAKQAAKSAAKSIAKEGAKSATKHAAKAAAKQGAKHAAKSAAKHGAKSAAKHAVKSAAKHGAKSAAKHAAKSAAKHGVKSAAKSAAKTSAKSAAKHAAKSASKAGGKHAFKTGAKATAATAATAVASLATPVGLVADGLQLTLETFGYEKAGKAVGASGNVASGAMTGFVLGGPFGAAIGGVAGYAVWKGGEVIGEYSGKLIDHYVSDEKKETNDTDTAAETKPDNSDSQVEDGEGKITVDGESTNQETAEASGIWESGQRMGSYISSWVGNYWSGKEGQTSENKNTDTSGSKPDDKDTEDDKNEKKNK